MATIALKKARFQNRTVTLSLYHIIIHHTSLSVFILNQKRCNLMFRTTIAWTGQKIIFRKGVFRNDGKALYTSSICGESIQQFNTTGPLAPCKSPRHASSALRHLHPQTIGKTLYLVGVVNKLVHVLIY